MGINLLAHDMDVCVVLEFSLFYIIYVCLDVLLGPLRPMSQKVRNRVIGDSFMYDAYQGSRSVMMTEACMLYDVLYVHNNV